MSEEYKKVAERLGVKHLFGRWGISFYSQTPRIDGATDKLWDIKLIPLDGWTFDTQEITQAIVDDGGSINVKDKSDD